ncbi:hypothetical protein HPC49_47580 [Pyxidicoccus fallax]|uniref:DUF4258 domain-containing protein n=1 Tax=Pyxidicoccus fallax TaxID=394095 RepID=A0A848LZL2_9BACT|nr:hypothetical protein [Pyxidicoccus fallax]NMO23061.1 hypothetical protein [Pyxidicoccus fallax]NPC85840.1 hypothetical protein [Pyxidicoccus fallax]
MCCPVPSRVNPLTRHFIERRSRRKLRDDVLDFILEFGDRARASGITHVTVLERDLPATLRDSSLARQARGWIVLLSDEERLVTCYRREDASRFIRRKSKRRMFAERDQRV